MSTGKIDEAVALLKPAADAGDVEALMKLGGIYATDNYGPKISSPQPTTFQPPSKRDQPTPFMRWARSQQEGLDGKPQYETAITLFEKATDAGSVQAIGRAGQALRSLKDYAKALSDRYQKAADKGLPEGMTALGSLYYDGNGVDQDDEFKAFRAFPAGGGHGRP